MRKYQYLIYQEPTNLELLDQKEKKTEMEIENDRQNETEKLKVKLFIVKFFLTKFQKISNFL